MNDSSAVCEICEEGIRLEVAGPDMGVLEGASVWEHDRFYPFGMSPHYPMPAQGMA